MSEARARLLRNNAAALRTKAATGEVAIATARDLSVRLPKALLEKVQHDLKTGQLEKRFAKALEDAKGLGDDQRAGALADVLTDFVKDVTKACRDYTHGLIASQAEARGRAQGIEEALEALGADTAKCSNGHPIAENAAGCDHDCGK